MRPVAAILAFTGLLVAASGRADMPLLPWVGDGDVPLAAWARSVTPKPDGPATRRPL